MENKQMELGAQVYWWCHGGGAFVKSGHFNWKHYCKVIEAKNEIIRNTILESEVRKEQANENTDNDNGLRQNRRS
jgi:hypothetical protein